MSKLRTPKQEWERWQRERERTGVWPTAGSRMTMHEYLVSAARWETGEAVSENVRGRPAPERSLFVLRSTVRDLVAMLRAAEGRP